jgi:hypothetical protein
LWTFIFLSAVACIFVILSLSTLSSDLRLLFCFLLRRKSKDWLPRNQDNVSE